MNLSNIELKLQDSQIGIRLYSNNEYLLSYTNLNDCIMDLIYHFTVDDLENICKGFSNVGKVSAPFKYRVVYSELFIPTDSISRYVFYTNTLSELIQKLESNELRAIKYPEIFIFGVQGVGIHIYNADTDKYQYWLGGSKPCSLSDILMQAKTENKIIPDYMLEEFSNSDNFDVFISHKSSDYKLAKQIYDKLVKSGRTVFLSELSLPAILNADYSFEIDNALGKSKHILVIATALENIVSGWVKYEWTSFANEIRSGRKNGNSNIVTFNCGVNLNDLPYLLRQYEVVDFNNIDRLTDFLP